MQIAHKAFEALLQDVRIDLRGRNISMAEQCLHHTQIGAIMQEMAGESVA